MGRYIGLIEAAEDNASFSEKEMDDRKAAMKAEWEEKAEPLRFLLSQLLELQEDLVVRNINVEIADRTNYPVFNEWQPSVDFQLEKPNAFPPRQSPLYRLRCSQGKYQVTTEATSGRDEGRKEDLGLHPLDQTSVDWLIRHAIDHYPWWVQ